MDRIAMNAQISARILAAQANGLPFNEALDAVLGAGTYERLVDETYHALRAKAVESGIAVQH